MDVVTSAPQQQGVVPAIWKDARQLLATVGASDASALIMCGDDQWDNVRPPFGLRRLRPIQIEFDRLSEIHGSEPAIRLMLGVSRKVPAAQPAE